MIDFFAKAMGEIKETKLSEIPEMPKFFDDLPERKEEKDSPVATVEMNEYSEEDLRSSPLSGTAPPYSQNQEKAYRLLMKFVAEIIQSRNTMKAVKLQK